MQLLPNSAAAVDKAAPAEWHANPIIYEINTWVWLNQLSRDYGRAITLANVPPPQLELLAAWGFDAVWLMGVWQRGAATRKSALNYLHEYRDALPDISEADVPGSAYAIHDYQVENQLGGRPGLAIFREKLREHGIKLILDFVPNHVASDHRWIAEHPEYFIQGRLEDHLAQPTQFFRARSALGEKLVIARGRDPYFPAWIDTAQLNAFQPGLRRMTVDTLIDIGSQCDGLRCDMAMLTTNAVFSQTWGERAGEAPALDYWTEVIPAVRAVYPQMLFMAEVYWDLEHQLQSQGFDFTYDKRMYDRLVSGDVSGIKAHLRAENSYLRSNIRFIENHDEPRAMESFGANRQRAAAALICTLPGAALLHQGQLEGRRIKLPVQVGRWAEEAAQPLLERFYRRLLHEVTNSIYRVGLWRMLEPQAICPGDFTHDNLISYTWQAGDKFRLIVVNLSGEWARARIELAEWLKLAGRRWLLYDALSASFTRHDGAGLLERGMELELPPFGACLFRFEPEASSSIPSEKRDKQ